MPRLVLFATSPLAALVLAACAAGDGELVGDTGAGGGVSADQPLFTEATLEPAFTHAASTWAGVALLDFDDDGWLDIYLTNGRAQRNALYRNLGDGRFEDVAEEAGVAATSEDGAVTSGDLDNDGDADLVVHTACSSGTFDPDGNGVLDGSLTVYLNAGDGTFAAHAVEVSMEGSDGKPVDPATRCAASLELGDLDGDGALDLVMANQTDPDLLPPWIFEKYEEASGTTVLVGDGEGGFLGAVELISGVGSFVTTMADFDQDGALDLVEGTAGQHVETHFAVAQGGADEPGEGTGDRVNSGRGLWMSLAVADYDGDGMLDLYGTNMGMSPLMQGYDNLSDLYDGGGVAEVTAEADPFELDEATIREADYVNPFHSVIQLDLEGHSVVGHPDWPLEAPQVLAGDLFEGLNDRYEQWVGMEGLARQGWGWGAVSLDVDADGWPDVAWNGNNCSAPMTIIWEEAEGASPGGLLRNQEGAGFEDWTWTAGVANVDTRGRYVDGRGIATGDLNNDGYADLVYANRGYNPSLNDPLAYEPGIARVWLSRPREAHWLQVDLEGSESNRDGIGGTVIIEGPDRTLVHAYGSGGALSSSSERLLTVGLGAWSEVDVEVRFPSGAVVRVEGVAADQRIVVEEGG